MIWAYNLAGYEITYLLPVLTRKFGNVDLQGPPNDCKGFSVNQKSIIFADVMKIINTNSLRFNCKAFNTVIQKE